MRCDQVDERLDDWLDGALSASAAREIEAHLAVCGACSASARKLRLLLTHAAALPRSVTPSHDLWPAIESRVGRRGARPWLLAWGSPVVLATAATVVIGVVAAIGQRPATGTVRTAEIPATIVPASAGTSLAVEDQVLAQAERDYEAAADALIDALRQRRAALSPETLARVEDNLQVIDRALAEVRSALARDPHNPELNQMLVATHRKKVDVLQRVVRLSTAL